MFVCAVANNGWISIVKVSIGSYGYSASRKVPKDPKNPLRFSYLTLYESPKRPIGKSESWVHTCLGTHRVPQLSAGARTRQALASQSSSTLYFNTLCSIEPHIK